MGAAAAKQLQPDKTKHAAIVMEAVRGYEEDRSDMFFWQLLQLKHMARI